MTNCTIRDNSTLSGNIGFLAHARSTANMTVTVNGSTFRGNRTIATTGIADDQATIAYTATGNTVTSGTPGNNQGNQGIEVSAGLNDTLTFNVASNNVGGLSSTPINVFAGSALPSQCSIVSGTTTANVTANAPVAPVTTASNGFGLRSFQFGCSSLANRIAGNSVSGVQTDYGILVEASGQTGAPAGNSTQQVQVANNSVLVNTTALDAIRLQARHANLLCATTSGNTTSAGGTGFYGMFLRQANTATFELEGLGAGAQAAGTAQAFAATQNPATPSVGAIAATSFTGVNAGTCIVP
jgi:hypothetical protein